MDIDTERYLANNADAHRIFQSLVIFQQSVGKSLSLIDYLRAAAKIKQAIPTMTSIDAFIESHRDDSGVEICGKLAICHAILQKERDCSLFSLEMKNTHETVFHKLETTWYNLLFQRLASGLRRKNIQSIFDDIYVISFNYDRTFEQFLYHALMNFFSVDHMEAAEVMRALGIWHPYGTVGNLPWEAKGRIVNFGQEAYGQMLVDCASEIKTFTERLEDTEQVNQARNKVSAADTIVFLGFAFHPQNMTIMKPTSSIASRIYATSLGSSQADCDSTADDLRLFVNNSGVNPFINSSWRCADLFSQNKTSI